jgi:hypothetical protein
VNERPTVIQIVATLVLALPGYLFCIAGFGGSIFAALYSGLQPDWIWPIGLALITAAITTGVIGNLMVASAGLIAGTRFYQRPRNAIAAVIGLEAAQLFSSTLMTCAVVGALASTTGSRLAWGWMILLAVAIFLLFVTHRAKKRFLVKRVPDEEAQQPADSGTQRP